jgi:hypothetical protein
MKKELITDKLIYDLDWDHLCDQCPEVNHMHQEASSSSAYGISWMEFISEPDGGNRTAIHEALVKWWRLVELHAKADRVERARFILTNES